MDICMWFLTRKFDAVSYNIRQMRTIMNGNFCGFLTRKSMRFVIV